MNVTGILNPIVRRTTCLLNLVQIAKLLIKLHRSDPTIKKTKVKTKQLAKAKPRYGRPNQGTNKHFN